MRAVNQPESWWGWHGWDQPEPLSITQVLQAGTMPPRLAAAFWLGLDRGASFVFAADPPGAGKTTILTALLAFAQLGHFAGDLVPHAQPWWRRELALVEVQVAAADAAVAHAHQHPA